MEQIGLEPSDGEIVYCELSLLTDQSEEYDTPHCLLSLFRIIITLFITVFILRH